MGKTIEIESINDMCLLMCDNVIPQKKVRIIDGYDNFDACYHTGIYEDYECSLCPHNSECSGYDEKD